MLVHYSNLTIRSYLALSDREKRFYRRDSRILRQEKHHKRKKSSQLQNNQQIQKNQLKRKENNNLQILSKNYQTVY